MKIKINNYFASNYKNFYDKYLPESKLLNGHEYQAKCPFHQEQNPSFNYDSLTGRYYCHGCGEKGDSFTFYGKLHNLDIRNGFPAILKGISDDFGINQEKQKPKFVKAYTYDGEDGKMLFQVCRLEPKSFRQRQPDGNGGWIWNMKGVNPVLYNLPEILKANEICIVEGEKDADNLASIGFTATTCPMGAKKWKPEYNNSLKGKDVILIPDNDTEGREHMTLIAQSLDGNIKSIKWLDLPGLPDKGDISDFITKFNDKEQASERLSILIDNAEPPKKGSQKKGPKGVTIGMVKAKFDYGADIKFLWRDVIPKGMPVIFNGREGDGKTSNCLQIAKEISDGHENGYVVWLATEGAVLDTIDKASKLEIHNPRFIIAEKSDETYKFEFSRYADLKELDTLLNELDGPVLAVFIDSIRGMSKYGDSDDEVGRIMHSLNAIVCDKHKASLIYIDHHKKGDARTLLDKSVGTTAKTSAVRLVISIIPKSKLVRAIKPAKTNIFKEIPELESIQVGDKIHIRNLTEVSDQTLTDQCQIWLTNLMAKNKEMYVSDVYRAAEKYEVDPETEKPKFSNALLGKVKETLPIKSKRIGIENRWQWFWEI